MGLWSWVRNPLWYSGYYKLSSRLEQGRLFSLFFKGYGNLYGEPEMGGNKCLLKAVGVAPLSVLELGG